MKLTVRIYGPTINGSWATLTQGYAEALSSFGALAGVVPVDAYDGDESYPGAEADVALVLGPASGMTVAKACGCHRLTYFMFAPNTVTVPAHIVNGILKGCDIMLVPSNDAFSHMLQFSRVDPDRIGLLHHGVRQAFQPMRHPDPDGPFTIFHHAWSAMERKGTQELQEAFRTWKYRDKSQLIISRPTPVGVAEFATWSPSRGFDAALEQYRQAHLVCQPSRGEGFGLIGHEARSCGRPFAGTLVGQHTDTFYPADPFGRAQTDLIVRFDCEHPELGCNGSPLQCELGEPAPIITPKAIQDALTYAFEHRSELLAWAMETADEFRARWSWEAVTADWYWRKVPVDLARQACTRRKADTITSEGSAT